MAKYRTTPWRNHNADELGQVGQQICCIGDHFLRLICGQTRGMQLFSVCRQHRVYKQAVSTRGRDAPCRGVGAGDKAQHLQIRHDVAYGGRREFYAGCTGKGARSDGLSVSYIAFNQCFQQYFGAIV